MAKAPKVAWVEALKVVGSTDFSTLTQQVSSSTEASAMIRTVSFGLGVSRNCSRAPERPMLLSFAPLKVLGSTPSRWVAKAVNRAATLSSISGPVTLSFSCS